MKILPPAALALLLAGASQAAYLLRYTATPKGSEAVAGSVKVRNKGKARIRIGDKTLEIVPRKEGKSSVKLSVKVLPGAGKGKVKPLWAPSVVARLGSTAVLSNESLLTLQITPSIAGK
jgi:hypothetical protein